MKASDTFKTIIENYLSQTALTDTALAISLAKASKSIEGCINYIGSEVKKTGLCAFADQEIFDIAVKYYNDDSISQTPKTNFKAVANQSVKADLFTPAPQAVPQNSVQETAVKQTIKTAPAALTLFDL